MPKHILFLIHGIGTHNYDWAAAEDGPITTLERVAKEQGYEFFRQKRVGDFVTFRPITWDETFEKEMGKWKSDFSLLPEADITPALQKWLNAASPDDRYFFWNHVADLVFYRFFEDYRNAVRTLTLWEMGSVLQSEPDREKCSVLAHGMGTAVAHDCIQLLGTTEWDVNGTVGAIGPADWRFQNVFMLSNMSRFLGVRDPDVHPPYGSIVRPGPSEDERSYCVAYHNFRHEYDPVTVPRRFDPPGWHEYYNTVVDHFHDLDFHGFGHYLMNPRVHIPILRGIVGQNAVTPCEESAAVNRFRRFGGNLASAKVQSLIEELKDMEEKLGEEPDFTDWLRALVRFPGLLEEYRAQTAA